MAKRPASEVQDITNLIINGEGLFLLYDDCLMCTDTEFTCIQDGGLMTVTATPKVTSVMSTVQSLLSSLINGRSNTQTITGSYTTNGDVTISHGVVELKGIRHYRRIVGGKEVFIPDIPEFAKYHDEGKGETKTKLELKALSLSTITLDKKAFLLLKTSISKDSVMLHLSNESNLTIESKQSFHYLYASVETGSFLYGNKNNLRDCKFKAGQGSTIAEFVVTDHCELKATTGSYITLHKCSAVSVIKQENTGGQITLYTKK